MAARTLSETLLALDADSELLRVRAIVSGDLELPAIARRLQDRSAQTPVVLFESVQDSGFPVVSNLWASAERLWRFLSVENAAEFQQRLEEFLRPERPEGWLEALRLVSRALPADVAGCRVVKTAACQQIVHMGSDINLSACPRVRAWPAEPAAAISGSLLIIKHPQTGSVCIDGLTLPMRDAQSLHVPLTPHHRGWAAWQAAIASQEPVEAAVILGGPPVYALLAQTLLPAGLDPYLLGGYLTQQPTEVIRGRTVDVPVLAGAEIVLEGRIDPTQPLEPCGPGVGPGERYSLRERAAVLTLTAMTHRQQPVWPCLSSTATERRAINEVSSAIVTTVVKQLLPEIQAMSLGVDRQTIAVSVHKQYPHHARQVVQALWGWGVLKTVKWVIVVDAEVDVTAEADVWREVAVNTQPGRDTVLADGPADYADHATAIRGLGRKIGIDATRKWPEEGHPRAWPERLQPAEDIEELVTQRWREYGLPE